MFVCDIVMRNSTMCNSCVIQWCVTCVNINYPGTHLTYGVNFTLILLRKPSTRFPFGISWSVTDRGVDETDEKEEKGEDWAYRGKVTSSVPGFNRFNMRPARHTKSGNTQYCSL